MISRQSRLCHSFLQCTTQIPPTHTHTHKGCVERQYRWCLWVREKRIRNCGGGGHWIKPESAQCMKDKRSEVRITCCSRMSVEAIKRIMTAETKVLKELNLQYTENQVKWSGAFSGSITRQMGWDSQGHLKVNANKMKISIAWREVVPLTASYHSASRLLNGCAYNY